MDQKPKLRLVRQEEGEATNAKANDTGTPAPKSAIGKELTRFADDLDAYIKALMDS